MILIYGILRNFLENGYYFNREKKYSNNKGKIEWKKTLENTPSFSNDNLIYTDIVTYKMPSSEDKIYRIYKLCLKLASERISWLFNYNINVEAGQPGYPQEMLYSKKIS